MKINRTFCRDVDLARELKKRSNQSYLVNQLLKKHLFDNERTKSQQTLEESSFDDLVHAAWMKAEPQSFESKMLNNMKKNPYHPTSSNLDANP